MIVVLDSNIFVHSTHMLGMEIGQQLLKLLEVRQRKISIPEISRTEYLEQARIVAAGYQTKLSSKAGCIFAQLIDELLFAPKINFPEDP